MKNLNLKNNIAIAMCIITISFTACKKKEVTPNTTTNPVEIDTLSKYNYYYSCTLDGVTTAWANNSTGIDSTKLQGSVGYYYFGSFAFTDIFNVSNSDTIFIAGHIFSPLSKNNSTFVGGSIYNMVQNKKNGFITTDYIQDTTGTTDVLFYRVVINNSDTISYNYKPISSTDKVHFNYTNTNKITGTFSGKVTLFSEYSSKTKQTIDYQKTNPDKMKQVPIEGKFSTQKMN